jgi:hypothetical protein
MLLVRAENHLSYFALAGRDSFRNVERSGD